MAVRAIRGAVQVDADEREAILEGTTELVAAVVSAVFAVTRPGRKVKSRAG